LILSVTGKPVCDGAAVVGVEARSGVAGGTALANGAVVASRPTEPSRDRKARREEEPNPEGASVSSPLFLLVSSDIISEFSSGAAASYSHCRKADNYTFGYFLNPPRGSAGSTYLGVYDTDGRGELLS
jgi:hypothetical protein